MSKAEGTALLKKEDALKYDNIIGMGTLCKQWVQKYLQKKRVKSFACVAVTGMTVATCKYRNIKTFQNGPKLLPF